LASAPSPIQVFREPRKHVERLLGFGAGRGRLLDDKGGGVHAEAADSELEPEADDLAHLDLDLAV